MLPFENRSSDKENAYFADGVQDEILTDLAKIAELKVISRTSVMQFGPGTKRNLPDIARALGVTYVLEGSVQRAGGKVRVTVQLIDARTDGSVWAERYDRELADVFAIQSEIANTIADRLQAKISPAERAAIEQPPTTNLAAYDLYTHAKSLIDTFAVNIRAKDDLLKAVRLLDEAVALDSSFLLAYCRLASAHGLLYVLGFDHTTARLALADAAVKNSLRISPESGEARFALAENYYLCQLDYDRALAELAATQKSLPNDARVFALRGFIFRRQGRDEEGVQNLARAIQFDPRNAPGFNNSRSATKCCIATWTSRRR